MIYVLDGLEEIKSLKHLCYLDLGNNNIVNINAVTSILCQIASLTSLILQGNPCAVSHIKTTTVFKYPHFTAFKTKHSVVLMCNYVLHTISTLHKIITLHYYIKFTITFIITTLHLQLLLYLQLLHYITYVLIT